jgi:UTP--glucose-1-phosphate uridylyltransferase
VIATMQVEAKAVKSYGILEEKKDSWEYFSVSKMLEKPDSSETPSRNAAIWKYVLTPDIFSYLEKAPLGKDWELRLADAFEAMRKEKDIYGLRVKGERFDTGSKIWFLKATVHYSLKNDEVKDEFLAYLKEITK